MSPLPRSLALGITGNVNGKIEVSGAHVAGGLKTVKLDVTILGAWRMPIYRSHALKFGILRATIRSRGISP